MPNTNPTLPEKVEEWEEKFELALQQLDKEYYDCGCSKLRRHFDGLRLCLKEIREEATDKARKEALRGFLELMVKERYPSRDEWENFLSIIRQRYHLPDSKEEVRRQ